MASERLQQRQFDRILNRVRRLFEFWDRGLDIPAKNYILRRIRDKEPVLFYAIANEVRRP